ncbi:MAG: AraC family transcriptional regulator [Burkholderiaceae bacterium]
MQRVLSHIENHPDQILDLRTLSGVANFSTFHFHRLFGLLMGQTIGDYVRRRRLDIAAERLVVERQLTVMQAALDVGFSSPEAFTRAFKARFKASPRAWRIQHWRRLDGQLQMTLKKSKTSQVLSGSFIDHNQPCNHQEKPRMEIQIIERQPVTVATMRHTGPYGESIERFFRTVFYPWLAANQLLGRDCYGISHDDPGQTPPAQCRYDACVQVDDGFVSSGSAATTIIPGGKYASLRFEGRAADIGEAWSGLFRDWLPASGYRLDARPCFEYYPQVAPIDRKVGDFVCDICVPVTEDNN